jgi:hypothetical protein
MAASSISVTRGAGGAGVTEVRFTAFTPPSRHIFVRGSISPQGTKMAFVLTGEV